MKYIVMDYKDGDLFTTEFDDLEVAISDAEWQWSIMTEYDKEHREGFFVLESANPDEDAESHLDGHIIKRWK